jgi:hypothetical protein
MCYWVVRNSFAAAFPKETTVDNSDISFISTFIYNGVNCMRH